jgi:hypothetical protein
MFERLDLAHNSYLTYVCGAVIAFRKYNIKHELVFVHFIGSQIGNWVVLTLKPDGVAALTIDWRSSVA